MESINDNYLLQTQSNKTVGKPRFIGSLSQAYDEQTTKTESLIKMLKSEDFAGFSRSVKELRSLRDARAYSGINWNRVFLQLIVLPKPDPLSLSLLITTLRNPQSRKDYDAKGSPSGKHIRLDKNFLVDPNYEITREDLRAIEGPSEVKSHEKSLEGRTLLESLACVFIEDCAEGDEVIETFIQRAHNSTLEATDNLIVERRMLAYRSKNSLFVCQGILKNFSGAIDREIATRNETIKPEQEETQTVDDEQKTIKIKKRA